MSRVELYREQIRDVRTDDVPNSTLHILSVRDMPGKWRWRFVSNGHVMADSGQGYSRRIDALNGCATVLGASWWGVDGHHWLERDSDADGIEVRDLTREATP